MHELDGCRRSRSHSSDNFRVHHQRLAQPLLATTGGQFLLYLHSSTRSNRCSHLQFPPPQMPPKKKPDNKDGDKPRRSPRNTRSNAPSPSTNASLHSPTPDASTAGRGRGRGRGGPSAPPPIVPRPIAPLRPQPVLYARAIPPPPLPSDTVGLHYTRSVAHLYNDTSAGTALGLSGANVAVGPGPGTGLSGGVPTLQRPVPYTVGGRPGKIKGAVAYSPAVAKRVRRVGFPERWRKRVWTLGYEKRVYCRTTSFQGISRTLSRGSIG